MDRGERKYRADRAARRRWERNPWLFILQPEYKPVLNKTNLRKNHNGCGCYLCKPWKHGKTTVTVAERRRIEAASYEEAA